MQVSAVPVAMLGDVNPVVGRVRTRLNMPGGNMLDRPLSEVLRGVQRAHGMAPTGDLDERTLALLDIVLY